MGDQREFRNRVALITGGASGIGRGIAKEFAKKGADIAILDIDEERGKSISNDIESNFDVGSKFINTDVSNYKQCQESIESVISEFGSTDILVNSAAGVSSLEDVETTIPFLDEEPEDWEPQIQITLKGVLNVTHAVLPQMVQQEHGGSVINIASEAYKGQDPRVAVYAAAKAGIVSFTKVIAKEVGEYDIRVNTISPATTKTAASAEWIEEYHDEIVKSYPLGRLGRPDDHGKAAVFLASDEADWITGQTLSVNGGYI